WLLSIYRARDGGLENASSWCWIASKQEPAMYARRHSNIAGDEEGESSEHRLLGHRRASRQQLPNAVGQVLVIRHYHSLFSARRRGSRTTESGCRGTARHPPTMEVYLRAAAASCLDLRVGGVGDEVPQALQRGRRSLGAQPQ